MADLVYRQPCQHGFGTSHIVTAFGTAAGSQDWCPGGSEIVLDPDKVLKLDDDTFVSVADFLAALEETE